MGLSRWFILAGLKVRVPHNPLMYEDNYFSSLLLWEPKYFLTIHFEGLLIKYFAP